MDGPNVTEPRRLAPSEAQGKRLQESQHHSKSASSSQSKAGLVHIGIAIRRALEHVLEEQ